MLDLFYFCCNEVAVLLFSLGKYIGARKAADFPVKSHWGSEDGL